LNYKLIYPHTYSLHLLKRDLENLLNLINLEIEVGISLNADQWREFLSVLATVGETLDNKHPSPSPDKRYYETLLLKERQRKMSEFLQERRKYLLRLLREEPAAYVGLKREFPDYYKIDGKPIKLSNEELSVLGVEVPLVNGVQNDTSQKSGGKTDLLRLLPGGESK